MTVLGYTAKQAEREKARVERVAAKANDALADLMRVVPDTSVSVMSLQEEVIDIERTLVETIERRTR